MLDGPAGEGLGRGFIRGAAAEGIALLAGATQPSPRPTTNADASDGATTAGAGAVGDAARPAHSVRGVLRDAALGLNDALAQSGDGEAGGVLSATRDVLGTALKLAISLAVVLSLVVAALALGIWFILAKARRARDEARLHEVGTARLLDALRAAEGRPWAPEFAAILRRSLESPAHSAGHKPRRDTAPDDIDSDWALGHREDGKRITPHPGRAERTEPV